MIDIDQSRSKELKELLLRDKCKVVIIAHTNPDGDALGSSFGLCRVLQNAGISATVLFPNSYPDIAGKLANNLNVIIYEEGKHKAQTCLNEADFIFYLDFNDLKRVGKMKHLLENNFSRTVLIDHHPDPIIFADYQFSETNVSSTAELVTSFIFASGLNEFLDADAANALLMGIIADTGSFSHNASRPHLYSTVSLLMEYGADKELVHETLYNNNSEERMRLLGYCLAEKMEVFQSFHTAIISLNKEELKRYHFQIGDTEGFVNYPLSIKGIIFSAFFMENEEKIKISFRSKGNFPVNTFSSAHFQGGGHQNAAGGESFGSLLEAITRFKELLPQYASMLENECSIEK